MISILKFRSMRNLSATVFVLLLLFTITRDNVKSANAARVCGVVINLPGQGCDENECNKQCVIQHGGQYGKSAHGYCNPSSQCVCFYACDGTNKCCIGK